MDLSSFETKCPRCEIEWFNLKEARDTLRCRCEMIYFTDVDALSLIFYDDDTIYKIAWNLLTGECHVSKGNKAPWLEVPYLDYKISLDKLKKIIILL